MTDPSGKIIDFPIKSSFRNGLSPMEYFISTHGARKGLADTALRTSDSGYLTRRLIDVAQDVMVTEEDCGTTSGVWISRDDESSYLPSFGERIIGYCAAVDIVHPDTGEIIVARNEEINEQKIASIIEANITKVCVRSPLTCHARVGICQQCYGRDLGRRQKVRLGTAVGIVAAQSIGEPGTQLTLRTLHTGGVVGTDITTGLPRVAELLEARIPKGRAVITEVGGTATIDEVEDGVLVRVTSSEVYRKEHVLPAGAVALVENGQLVDVGSLLYKLPDSQATDDESKGMELTASQTNNMMADIAGEVVIEGDIIYLQNVETYQKEYFVPHGIKLLVKHNDVVEPGQQITEGVLAPHDILQVVGKEAVQKYLVDEVQKVYRSQGVNIHDKHIAVIVRQMLQKVMITNSGDTKLLPGELTDQFNYEDINTGVIAEGGDPATAQAVLLGISRASLSKESWLASASFQETGRVLVDAATKGKTTKLLGLKENVILGRLIPSRILTDEDLAEITPELEAENTTDEMSQITATITEDSTAEQVQEM